MEELFKRIMEAHREALKNEINANIVLINENLGLVKEFCLAGANYPKMICGLEVKVTNELPDNVSFVVTEVAQTEREKLIEQTRKDILLELADEYDDWGEKRFSDYEAFREFAKKYGMEIEE